MRVAVIGSGVSGIAAGKTLSRLGHQVVVFERNGRVGGHWTQAYPGVHLQNLAELYEFTDFPWPFAHDDYPPAAEIVRYLEAAVAHFKLDVRLSHEVLAMARAGDSWALQVKAPLGERVESFDAGVIAAGHYTGERQDIELKGRDTFKGRIISEHDIGDLSVFDGKRVAVVGFGKAAVDVLNFALGRARCLHHVFREARWLLPRKMFGMSTSRVASERMSVGYTHSWVYPNEKQRRMHERNPKTGAQTDAFQSNLIKLSEGLRGPKYVGRGKSRLKRLEPAYPIGRQLRGTLAPDSYFPAVARGAIEPHASAATGFSEDALLLADGTSVPADVVVLSVGYKRPAMPYLPEPVRSEFADSTDGTQLYRHVVHPRLERIGFAGYNHNPLHFVSAEIGALWLDAAWSGALSLPSPEAMQASADKVRDWKRTNTIFEPTRAYWVGAHFHNYLDVMLRELGLRSHRKSNPIAENMDHYTSKDYRTIIDEYVAQRGTPRASLPFDT
jgi:dimethylaniline monooxygenase (N-oxide forming)